MTGKEIRSAMISARDEYISIIRSELLGPGSEFSWPDKEHELISSTPTSRYSLGILFPQGNENGHDNDETVQNDEEGIPENELIRELQDTVNDPAQNQQQHTLEIDETADENLDEEIGMATQYWPSSMGMTFLIKGDASIIRGKLSFATYRGAGVSDCALPYNPEFPENYKVPTELAHIMEFDKSAMVLKLKSRVTPQEVRSIFERDTIPENEHRALENIAYRFADYCRMGHVRVPHSIPEFTLDFSAADYLDDEANSRLDGTTGKIVALRRRIDSDVWSITVMLVNDIEEAPAKAEHCIFQARMEIDTSDNRFVFVESNSRQDISTMDDEERSLDLLYRNKKTYGTGLGTSVDWEIDTNGKGRLWNEFFPIREIPAMSFSLPANNMIQDRELSMKYLSDLDSTDKARKIASLKALVDLYKEWVDGLEHVADSLDERHASPAAKNIAECKRAYRTA